MSQYVTRQELAAALRAMTSFLTGYFKDDEMADVLAEVQEEPEAAEPNGESHNAAEAEVKNHRVSMGIAKRFYSISQMEPDAVTIGSVARLAAKPALESPGAIQFLSEHQEAVEEAATRGRKYVNSEKKDRAVGWHATDIAMLILLLLPFGAPNENDIRAVIKPRRRGTKFSKSEMPAVFARALDELGVTDEYLREVVAYFAVDA